MSAVFTQDARKLRRTVLKSHLRSRLMRTGRLGGCESASLLSARSVIIQCALPVQHRLFSRERRPVEVFPFFPRYCILYVSG